MVPEMLCKATCQKCYRFNEREWGEEEEREWSEEGCILCPIDHFSQIKHKGKMTNTGKMRGIFRWVFGWHEIDDEVPVYCEFSSEHGD